jgi:hypothetical protein
MRENSTAPTSWAHDYIALFIDICIIQMGESLSTKLKHGNRGMKRAK